MRLARPEVELRGLARDSFMVGLSQGAVGVGQLVQLVLITHALGLREFGRFSLVVSFVLLVSQFFDVRVAQATITFGAGKVGTDPRGLAGIIQLGYVIDLVTGVVAFAVVAALAPLVGPRLVGAEGTSLVILYALTLLASTVDNSSNAVLRLFDRYALMLGYAVISEIARVGLVLLALAASADLTWVVIALLVHDVASALATARLASVAFRKASGASLLQPALAAARDVRGPMMRMILHTNVVGYARMAQTQLPTVVLGALRGPLEAGVYRVGMAAAAVVGRLADPAYFAVLPRLARLWSAGRRDDILRLVRQSSWIAVPAMALATGLLVWFREPVFRVLGGHEAVLGGGSVVVFGALAHGLNGALFWNVPLLTAAGRAAWLSRAAVLGLVLQLSLLPLLADRAGAPGAALALFVSLSAVNMGLAVLALRVTAREPSTAPDFLPVHS